ncbi:MAG: four-carbon acid sugar kinase family protein, partial [Burkholderiales bacterium]|nr:four-carbon acid sugar kinase family protein [Burkholderiales bacterium]
EVFRLDRHPVMSRHPSTPMHESDLRVHLSHQTKTEIGLMSVTDLDGDDSRVDARETEILKSGPGMVLYDALTGEHLSSVGRLIWRHGQRAPHFVIGSSGVEYALAAHWRTTGVISDQRKVYPAIKPVKQLLAVSGSASPMTAQQIDWAANNGFDCIRIPTEKLAQPAAAEQVQRELVAQGLTSLSGGNSVLLYSARGPDDSSIQATRAQLGADKGGSARVLGSAMGRITRELLTKSGLRRVVIAGGDTSSYATQELKLYALEMLGQLTPGAPLCRGYSDEREFDGLEIALKGGQMGKVDYFGMVRGR